MKLTAEERACLEYARRAVCGHTGNPYVQEDGMIISGPAAFKLDPSRDEIDALIITIARAMQRHFGGVDLGKLRLDLIAAGMGEQAADFVEDHLRSFSVADWSAIEMRTHWYSVRPSLPTEE